jgi:hypothetical protein
MDDEAGFAFKHFLVIVRNMAFGKYFLLAIVRVYKWSIFKIAKFVSN